MDVKYGFCASFMIYSQLQQMSALPIAIANLKLSIETMVR